MKQQALDIISGQKNYSVTFPETIRSLVQEMEKVSDSLVIIDEAVARIHSQDLSPLLSERKILSVPATEDEKTPAGVNRAWEFFQKSNATKQTSILVIGGGIIQDIAQFACHNYYRGLKWHFAPTTLLSQADSCIGAKCGINLGAFKNQLGVFHSPAHVWICPQFLETLDDTEIRSGYGEIIKLHLTRSESELFRELAVSIRADGWRGPLLGKFIRQSLEVKKSVIEEDEYEKDLRRILNYGHTFGHALEAMTNHSIPHGIAVAWGIDLINYISMRRGVLDEKSFIEVHDFLREHYYWKIPTEVTAGELILGARRDKKVADGKVNLVLAADIGKLTIAPTEFDDELLADVTSYLENHNVISWN